MISNVIAKNTLFLYFRMMLIMFVSLYTSRVILQTLGVDDFGLYQTVGGVVALLSFLNSALAAGSSRFLTFALGQNEPNNLKKTFSSVLIVHILLALAIILVAEFFGLWFVCNKLNVPPFRMDATVFAFHFTVVSIFFTITQVPYNASIISHEKMSAFAYISILEVLLRLAVAYGLLIGSFDKLKMYAVLLCIVQIGIACSYRIYCLKKFPECRCMLVFDKTIVKNVVGFVSWNILTNTASALVLHGATVLTNMFYNPGVVTARAVANQVNSAATQFIENFRQASSPQIIKRFAARDYDGSKHLLIESTKISFYMMLVLCLPIIFTSDTLLKLWLGILPEYSVSFLRLAIVTSLFIVFGRSFFIPLSANGRLKDNAISIAISHVILLAVVFFLFRTGLSPIVLAWALLVEEFFLCLVIKPYLLVKIVGYKWSDLWMVFTPCIKVTLIAVPIPLAAFVFLQTNAFNEYARFAIMVPLSVLSVCIAVWFVGLTTEMKGFVKQIVQKMINKNTANLPAKE